MIIVYCYAAPFPQASVLYRQALRLNPKSVVAMLKLASVSIELGDVSDAEMIYSTLMSLFESTSATVPASASAPAPTSIDAEVAAVDGTDTSTESKSHSAVDEIGSDPIPAAAPAPAPALSLELQVAKAWVLVNRVSLWVTR